jgi:thiamine biosynthesis lipoprotein
MMQRRQCLRLGLGLLGATYASPFFMQSAQAVTVAATEKLIWRERNLVGFGTTLWIKAAHVNIDQLETGLTAAVAAIRNVERQMSLYDPESALSRLNAHGVLQQPDVDLTAVLNLSKQVSMRSAGTFDVSMQPLWKVWSQAKVESRLPTQRERQQAKRLVNWRAVELSASSVRLNLSGMSLSLNGIAQGYASDKARAALEAHGIQHAVIDAGETSLLGHAPNDQPWSFSIEDAAMGQGKKSEAKQEHHLASVKSSMPIIVADGRAMATSSDSHTVFSTDRKHHHILNPHSGDSPLYWSSVTVLAPSCVMADALTKVFFMLPPAQIDTAARRWGVDVMLQDKAGKWRATAGVKVKLTSHV